MIRENNPPFRSYILNCVKDDSYLPIAYRWLYKYHVPESISKLRPYCNSYSTYRALPIPPDGNNFGTYNFIMTEHHWMYDPSEFWGPEGRINILQETFGPEFLEATNQPPMNSSLRDADWAGTRDGYHPIVYVAAPLFWEKEYKGQRRTAEDGANYRWLVINKYPKDIDKEKADKWFIEEFLPKMAECPEVTRLVTSKARPHSVFIKGTWDRVTEIWFDNSNKWHDAVSKCAETVVKPDWAKYDSFPYIEPYVDFTGIFLLDRPESDHFNQYHGYITTR